jgi:tetratricopeptide (TPR) repeat protein
MGGETLSYGDALRRGMAAQNAGRHGEAAAIYRSILEARADDANALNLLGTVLIQTGDLAGAQDLLARAAAVKPDAAAVRYNYATLLEMRGKREAAEEEFRAALALDSENVGTLIGLAGVLRARGNHAEALELHDRSVSLAPDDAAAWLAFSTTATEAQGAGAASKVLDRALAGMPGDARLWNAKATALRAQGRLHEALACADRAAALDPASVEAMGNRGILLLDLGDADAAGAVFDTLARAHPDAGLVQWSRALSHLFAEEYAAGFALYEWRWRIGGWVKRDIPLPEWTGEDLTGKTIVVACEQGLGDMVQFVRFLPLLRARGATVILEAYKALRRLFGAVADAASVKPFDAAFPEADYVVHMLDLPHRLSAGPADAVAPPYLSAPAGLAFDLPPAPKDALKVGVCWSSNPSTQMYEKKSCGLAALGRLAAIGGVALYSLQKGEDAAEIATVPFADRIVDLAPRIQDLTDTAAAMAQLDLIVSIDTVVAHLAGALGRETWTLLPFAADWRWHLGRDDSPWYPSMRLFRQPREGDWDGVIDQLAGALRHRVDQG